MSSSTKTYIVPINVQALRIAYSDTTEGRFKWPEFYFPNMTTTLPDGRAAGIGVGPDVIQPLSSLNNGANKIIGINNDGEDAGIRLHWAMPRAVVNGRIGNESNGNNPSKLVFPKLPNRWLITAYYYDHDKNNKSVKQWIIESDSVTSTKPQKFPAIAIPNPISLPNLSLGKTPYPLWATGTCPQYDVQSNYLGNVISDISKWKEPGGQNTLEAHSIYGPSFTAYYMHSATAFGFYDPLMHSFSPQNCNIDVSYQIIGWYNNAVDDIASQTFKKAQNAYSAYMKKISATHAQPMSELEFVPEYFERELGWKFSAAYASEYDRKPYAFSSMPDSCASIYNGMILSLSYKSGTNYIPEAPTSTDVKLAIGNNIPEAVSSLLVHNSRYPIGKDAPSNPNSENQFPTLETKADMEYLLNAFQQDILRRLGPSNSTNRIEQVEGMLHDFRFSTYPGGTTWLVRPKSTLGTKNPSTQASEVQLPLVAAQSLSLLNEYQGAYDESIRKITTARQQLFLDWTNLAYRFNDSKGKTDITADHASLLMAELCTWFVLEAETGVLSVSNAKEIAAAANKGAKNVAYAMEFTPQMTVVNKTVDTYILSSGLLIKKILQNNISGISHIGLGELYVILGVLLPVTLEKIQTLLDSADSDVEAHGSILPNLLTRDFIQQLSNYQNILTNISGLLSTTYISTTLATLSATLAKQKGDLRSLNNTLKDYAATMSTGQTSISDFYNTLSSGLLSGGSDSMAPVLSKPEYSGIYDVQAAIVCLEFFSSAFASDITKTNTGYGYVVDAWNKATQASETVDNISTHLANTINSANVLNSLNSFITSANAAISSLNTNPTTPNLKAAIASVKISKNTQRSQEDFLANIYKVSTGLLESLPKAHQVVTATKIMNMVTDALEEEVLLQQKKAPSFHLPSDPVLALSEPSTDKTQYLRRVNRNGVSTHIPCRQSENILTSISVGGTSINPPPDGTFALSPGLAGNTLIKSLLFEGYLLAPENSGETGDIKKLLDDYKAAQQHLSKPPLWKNESTDAVSFKGILPYYIGLTMAGEGNPFLPLFISWKVNYIPMEMELNPASTKAVKSYDPEIIASDRKTSNFVLHGSDLRPNQKIKMSAKSISLSSQMLLSDAGNTSLVHQIRNFFKHKWNIDLNTIAPTKIAHFTALQRELYQTYLFFTKDTVLAQGISGFNAALLERIQSYQFSFNYSGNQQHLKDGTNLLASFVDLWDKDNPDWKSFNPIRENNEIIDSVLFSPLRAGTLSIDSLEIVDVFGRFLKVDTSDIRIAQSMQFSENKYMGNNTGSIYLAPRFTQPTRLRFLWESSESLSAQPFQEYNSNTAFSPVCGWLMPNHLDDSMFVYNVDGKALGYFETPTSAIDLKWRSKPQSNGTGDNNLTNDIKGANPVFVSFITDFLNRLTGGSNGTAETFQTAILKSNQFLLATGLKESLSMSVIKGRALVLTQAHISLEIYGNPPVAMGNSFLSNANSAFSGKAPTDDLTNDAKHMMRIPIARNPQTVPASYPTYDHCQRNTAGIEGVNVPVMIGNDGYLNDGLVGYFIGGDFSTFYAVSDIAPHSANGISIQKASPILLNLSNNSGVSLTLVMDPRVPVHAITGMLPEQSIQIPPDEYQKAMGNLKVYVSVSPILLESVQNISSAKEVPGLLSPPPINYEFPLPKEIGYEWSWVQPTLSTDQALKPNAMNDKAKWYSYLEIQDGWLKLNEVTEE